MSTVASIGGNDKENFAPMTTSRSMEWHFVDSAFAMSFVISSPERSSILYEQRPWYGVSIEYKHVWPFYSE